MGDAAKAYESFVSHGGLGKMKPVVLRDEATGTSATVAEVHLYGDVVIRLISGDFKGPFLPNYEAITHAPIIDYGINQLGRSSSLAFRERVPTPTKVFHMTSLTRVFDPIHSMEHYEIMKQITQWVTCTS